jgi:hypothetical protein
MGGSVFRVQGLQSMDTVTIKNQIPVYPSQPIE